MIPIQRILSLLGILALLSSDLVGKDMILLTSSGQEILIEVHPEDRFLDVIDAMREQEAVSQAADSQSDATLKLDITVTGSEIHANASSYSKGQIRNYYTPLSPKEKADVSYILRTLSNSSLVKITSHKSSLKKAGDRIEHIHPYRFLAFVFSNDELIVCMRNLQGRSWVWREFVDGVVGSLRDEASVGNLKPEYVNDFATHIKIDSNQIIPTIVSQRWEDLINLLIAIVPRQGDSTRYDM